MIHTTINNMRAAKRTRATMPWRRGTFRFNSLALKLTLAFLVVGLLGALPVAAIVQQRTERAYNQFLSARDKNLWRRCAIITSLMAVGMDWWAW